MADELLAEAVDCLILLRESLDGARLGPNEETAYAPHAIALLSRMVHLCEAAIDLASTVRRSAAAVVLRPALECWIDCCYVLYCKWEAVLQLTSLGLREREKLAKIWLGDAPVAEIVAELAALDAVVLQGLAAGALADGFKLRSSMSLEARLGATIKCRGAALSYLDVYTYLYRAISFGEIHTSSALEFHAVYGEDHFGFKVTPLSTLDVTTLIALSVRLACGAAVDVFEVLGTDSGAMARRSSSLDSLLQRSVAEMAQQLDASSSPEIQRALDVIRRRE